MSPVFTRVAILKYGIAGRNTNSEVFLEAPVSAGGAINTTDVVTDSIVIDLQYGDAVENSWTPPVLVYSPGQDRQESCHRYDPGSTVLAEHEKILVFAHEVIRPGHSGGCQYHIVFRVT